MGTSGKEKGEGFKLTEVVASNEDEFVGVDVARGGALTATDPEVAVLIFEDVEERSVVELGRREVAVPDARVHVLLHDHAAVGGVGQIEGRGVLGSAVLGEVQVCRVAAKQQTGGFLVDGHIAPALCCRRRSAERTQRVECFLGGDGDGTLKLDGWLFKLTVVEYGGGSDAEMQLSTLQSQPLIPVA